MRELEWDAELASVAQALAEQCTDSEGESDHDNYRDRFTTQFPKTGQNLAFRGRNFPFHKNDWTGRVREWFVEHADYEPERRHSFRKLPQDKRKPTGHFTQLVWAETSFVGCGFVEYSVVNATRLPYMQYYVCNYAATGNVFKRPLYREGEPCSACPAGTVCDKGVGLCSLEGKKENSQLGKEGEKLERAEPNAAASGLYWQGAVFCTVVIGALGTLRGQRAIFLI
ncbi:hypothetical protein HPB52_019299 [Rhipicephalus sanguineus]|uniref:SCP domain-containing protein n=2 Tax=Rhipicephalus sanguineus TaxID=34632 RepID=A0A9D4PD07_RHISA|nr:hypothetical protein HPB52_019299 [Rhipicephalus sanguineus]